MVKSYSNSVFINCPFDDGYRELFYAVIFTVYHCGFIPRSALEEDNALHNRLAKIESIIEHCKFGIHDISRIEVNSNALPRFNMPFELGVFYGAKRFGDQKQRSKVALVLERQKFLYQQYISDINGIDTKAHNNDPVKAIKLVRDWLQTATGRKAIAGNITIVRNFENFKDTVLPNLVSTLGLEIDDLSFNDYCAIVETSMRIYNP